MKKILTRTVFGCIYVALIVTALTLDSPYLFFGVFSLFIIFGILEFHRLAGQESSFFKYLVASLDSLGGITMFAASACLTTMGNFTLPATIYLAYFIIRMVVQLYDKSDNAIASLSHSFMGQMYVAMPLSLLNVIYFNFAPHLLLAIFIMIWLNDTGAFCVGSLFGKHRLFERISPKKSWEGFWGGFLFCIIAGILFYFAFNSYFSGLNLFEWILLGIVVAIFSTWGDLCESLIKRTLHVKDSGHIIPGHGGLLDRIDSLLLVTPASILFLILTFLS